MIKIPSTSGCQHLDLLVELTSQLNQTDAMSRILEIIFQKLQEGYGATALVLETVEESTRKLQTYGDFVPLLEGCNGEAIPEGVADIIVLAPFIQSGRLLISFPKDSRPNDAILFLLASSIGQRLNMEAVYHRAREAEYSSAAIEREVVALYNVGQALDRIEHTRLLQLITDSAAHLMNAHTCSLMILQKEAHTLQVVASHGLLPDAIEYEQPLGRGLAGRVAQTEQPLLLVGDMSDAALGHLMLRPEISSSMLVPMKTPEGDVIGVLSISRKRPSLDFNDTDLRLFTVFAAQAALALANKQLFDGLQRRATELEKISTLSRSLITTLDLDELLDRVVREIGEVVGFDRCCIYFRDAARSVFAPRCWHGYQDSTLQNPVREGEGVVGFVGRHRQQIFFQLSDSTPTEEDEARLYKIRRGFARSLGVESYVAMPLLDGKNRCIGVVVADNRHRHLPISQEQIHLLSIYTGQAGIAIENARLYDATNENLQKINRLNSETNGILQSIGASILSVDARGQVIRSNRAANELFKLGRNKGRAYGLSEILSNLRLPQEELDTIGFMLAQVLETGERARKHKWTLNPEDSPPLHINLQLSRLEGAKKEDAGVVISLEDVTKEVQLEAELEGMRRLADIGQLAAKMAHEVRNALAPIKGAAQIIQMEQEKPSEWSDIILTEVESLNCLTSEMLDFARPKSLVYRMVHPAEHLHLAVHSLGSFLEENRVNAVVTASLELPLFQADPVQLGQATRNLIMNAVQAMPAGGTLTLHADVDLESQLIRMEFRDTGIGIPTKDRERIFLPFVTTRPKGTGLGLSIVLKVIQQHHGRIEVNSQLGSGTCFTVYLPMRSSTSESEEKLETAPLISHNERDAFPDN